MKAFIDIIKQTRPGALLFFSGYALYLVFTYMVFHSATALSVVGDFDFGTQTMFTISVVSTRVVVFAVVIGIQRFLLKVSTSVLAAVSGAAALMGFLVTGMILQFSGSLSAEMFLPWLMVGGVFLGFGDTSITLLWARFSSTLTLRTVYLYVVSCNALSLIIYFIVTLLPGKFSLLIAAFLFLVSIIFVKKALDIRGLREWEYSRPVFQSAFRSLCQPILGTVILFFMAGLMLQISGQQEVPLSNFQQTSLLTSAVVVLFLFLPALLLKKPFNVGRMYAVALPLSAAGFLLLPLMWNAVGGIVNSFAQLGAMVASLILWCMLADKSYDTKLPPNLLFAIALVCTEASFLAGTVVGHLNADTLKHGDIVLTAVALVAAYLLFMVALFLFKDKSLERVNTETYTETQAQAIRPGEFFFKRCGEIAAAHQFTPREGEIFILLAQGYTVPAISEKLYVSENTVKSHVKSIYMKLDIHARAELIKLVGIGSNLSERT